MDKLVIIGAGGYGRVLCNFATQAKGYGRDFTLKGFIDDTEAPLRNYSGYPPVLSKISEYEPEPGDVFICAIGDIAGRKKCSELIEGRGGRFISLISRNATIERNSVVGRGCVVQTGAQISCDCRVSEHVHIQGLCIVGHDVEIGAWSFLHCGAFIGGASRIGEGVRIYPYALVHPRKKIGDYATIGAGAFIIRSVAPHATMYGNPAKQI